MAKLKLENGKVLTELEQIRSYLAPLKVELSHWPIEKTEKVGSLLLSEILNDHQKEDLLQSLDSRFEEQQQLYGYQSRDLISIYSTMPQLSELLAKFDKCHRHDDDEVRYIVDGSGIFGFVMPNAEQVSLTVEAEEYIRVPANTEHWFILDKSKRIKAVRYFTSREGWVAHYTGTTLRV